MRHGSVKVIVVEKEVCEKAMRHEDVPNDCRKFALALAVVYVCSIITKVFLKN